MSQSMGSPSAFVVKTDKSTYYVTSSIAKSKDFVSFNTRVGKRTINRVYSTFGSTNEMIASFKQAIEEEESKNDVPIPAPPQSLDSYRYLTLSDANIMGYTNTGYTTGASNYPINPNWKPAELPTPRWTDSLPSNTKIHTMNFTVRGISVPVMIEEEEERWRFRCPYLDIGTSRSKLGYSSKEAVEQMEALIDKELERRGVMPIVMEPEKMSYEDYSGLISRLSLEGKIIVESKNNPETPPELKVGDSINVKIKDFMRSSKRTFAIVKDITPSNQVELILSDRVFSSKRKLRLWKGDFSQIRDHEKIGDYFLGKAILKSYENSAAAFGNKGRLKKLLDSKERLIIEEEMNNYTLASGRIIPKVYKVQCESKIIKIVASDVEVTPFDLKGWNTPKQRNLELGCQAIIKDDRKLRSIKREDVVTIIKFMQMQYKLEKAVPRIAKVKTESGEEHLVPCKVLKRL